MPGNTPYDAFRAFADPLASALNCVSEVRLETSPGGRRERGKVHSLYLTGTSINDGYVMLRGDAHLEFRARMFYEIIEDHREGYGPLRVTTRAYDYSIRLADHRGVVDYHWHPTGLSHERRPHIHLGTAQLAEDAVLAKKHHVLSGRVTFEAVIRMAIQLGARPITARWDDRLTESEGPHILFRSWS